MNTLARPGELQSTLPTKLLPGRPTLASKRIIIEETGSPRLAKKLKVSFSSDVEVRLLDVWEKSPKLIQEEVGRALEKHACGDPSSYLEVKDIFSANKIAENEPSTATLRSYTAALIGNVSLLNKSCSDLVYSILNSPWLSRSDEYATLYTRFLANLVSAQGVYLADALRMLVENLTASKSSSARHTSKILTAHADPPSLGSPSKPVEASRSQIRDRVHRSLQYILRLIPSASRLLSNILAETFPHETDSRRSHVVYVRSLLKLITYTPELECEILALVTERLVKIDVQVQVDLEDLAENVEDGVVQEIPGIKPYLNEDLDDSESSDDESITSDQVEDVEAERNKDIARKVEKMDIILDLLFGHFAAIVSRNPTRSHFEALNILLSQFSSIILPTQRSRHTQFLLFHFAQLSPTLIDTFVGTCVHIAFDKIQPVIVRQAAAAYLASFVARGTHVPSNIVRDVFEFIGAELERLRGEHEPSCRGPSLRRYSSYYSLVQALMYIFCFRWRDLEYTPGEDFEEDDSPPLYGAEHQWKSGVKEILGQNIFSKLNPLKVCSPIIVHEFARVANHVGIIYVFHLLETNKRIQLTHYSGLWGRGDGQGQPERETALSARKDDSHQHLDEYFPFDPYHLPRSKRWIEGDYREWTRPPGLDDNQGSETSSDEDEGGDSENEDGTATDETGSHDLML